MPVGFTVLASGSAGNASLLQCDGFGLLVDAGLGPRQLSARMAAVGASWDKVHAVLLTHTHTDHWNDRILTHLRRRRIPLYCHREHHDGLLSCSWPFGKLRDDRLVHGYEAGEDLVLTPGLRCRPFAVPHDGGATFGFRFAGDGWSVAYAADLGSWTAELAQELAEVDLLALEFNHDVEMEYTSGRSARLIARVLGDHGHLSNDQAAALLQEVLRLSTPGRLRHLVQLHLSRDCNDALLAATAARAVLNGAAAHIQVHTARQDRAGPVLAVEPAPLPSPETCASVAAVFVQQRWLPGLEPLA